MATDQTIRVLSKESSHFKGREVATINSVARQANSYSRSIADEMCLSR